MRGNVVGEAPSRWPLRRLGGGPDSGAFEAPDSCWDVHLYCCLSFAILSIGDCSTLDLHSCVAPLSTM